MQFQNYNAAVKPGDVGNSSLSVYHLRDVADIHHIPPHVCVERNRNKGGMAQAAVLHPQSYLSPNTPVLLIGEHGWMDNGDGRQHGDLPAC